MMERNEKKFSAFAILILAIVVIGCTQQATTLSYEPSGADQLIPSPAGYQKVDLEDQTVKLSSLAAGSFTAAVAGGNPKAAMLAAEKMDAFSSCLVQSKAASVKGFYSETRGAVAVMGVGEANAKKILACAIRSTLPLASPTPVKTVTACHAVYETKAPSGTSYFVGITGVDQEGGAICQSLCIQSLNGCAKIETVVLGNYY
jgi:hypothetical protein